MEDHKSCPPGTSFKSAQDPVAGSTHEKDRGPLPNSNANPVGHFMLAPILKAT